MMMRVAADEQAAPLAGADNFAIDPGNGYLDLSWNAIDGATAYDIRAKESGAANWHSVANKVTGTSYRYTTDKKIDYVAVRGVQRLKRRPLGRTLPDTPGRLHERRLGRCRLRWRRVSVRLRRRGHRRRHSAAEPQ